jgi:replicative DNA helicase
MSDSPPFFVINKKNNSTLTTNPLFYSLKQRLKKYKLVILDPFLGFYGGDENNNSDAKFFMNHFQIWAKEEDKVIIFLTHSTKKEKKTRGAGALTDACRLVYEVELIDENKSLSERQIRVSKDNYGVIKILNQDTITRQILPKQKKRLAQQIKFDANF